MTKYPTEAQIRSAYRVAKERYALLGIDTDHDLALIKIRDAKDLPTATLGSSADLRVGVVPDEGADPVGPGLGVVVDEADDRRAGGSDACGERREMPRSSDREGAEREAELPLRLLGGRCGRVISFATHHDHLPGPHALACEGEQAPGEKSGACERGNDDCRVLRLGRRRAPGRGVCDNHPGRRA